MKIGVIGLGSIGLRHAQNLRTLGHEVVAYDIDDQKMIDWQGRTITNGEIFSDRDIDAVVSASPSGQHIHDLCEAEAYGVPIFVEKPIAMSVGGRLQFVIARAKNDGLPIMVGYNLRFHSCAIKAKEWLDKGMIGNRQWATFTCAQFSNRPSYLRDGVIRNWSHEIDLARYLLGPADCVSAACPTRPGIRFNEDVADIVLAHENGAHSTIHLDYITSPEIREFMIVGTLGHIRCDLVRRSIVLQRQDGKGQSFHGKDSYDENYITEIEAFTRYAQRKPAFGATGEDGLAVLQICDDARKLAKV